MALAKLPKLFDPWIGDAQQSARIKAYCQVWVGGTDVTDRLKPYLLSVRVVNGGNLKNNCEIELDDRDGRLDIPPPNATAKVVLGWQSESTKLEWNGYVDKVEHGAGRRAGGRRMWVHCMGANLTTTQLKTPMQNSWGRGAPPGQQVGMPIDFGRVASAVASSAGAIAQIHPAISAQMRDYWNQHNESAIHFFMRHAQQFGAFLQFTNGNNIMMTMPGQTIGGFATPIHFARWGVNLIQYRVYPFVARSNFQSANQQYFSTLAAQWQTLAKKFGLPNPWGLGQGIFSLPVPAPNAQVAGQQNDGAAQNAAHDGEGRVCINGEPAVKAQDYVQIEGVRPGVDGRYLILQAEHVYSRQGYLTWMTVRPEASATAGGTGQSSISYYYPQAQKDAGQGTRFPSAYPTAAPSTDTSVYSGSELEQQQVDSGTSFPLVTSTTQLVVNGVTVTNPDGTLITDIWRDPMVMAARIAAIMNGTPDPLAGFPGVPPAL